MNSSTGKFAKWYVRVIAPKIIDNPIKARGETIAAQKFECVLVSKDSSQYMLGLVPFAFSDRGAAQKAMDKFTENHVFEITQPAFDTKAKSEFNGCPVKIVLLLSRPNMVTAATPANMEMLEYPAKGITVSMDCLLYTSPSPRDRG